MPHAAPAATVGFRRSVGFLGSVALTLAACGDVATGAGLSDAVMAAPDSGPELAFHNFDTGSPAKTDAMADSSGAEGVTAPTCEFSETPAKGQAGSPCFDNGDCDANLCVEAPQGKVCSIACVSCCPAGWNCADVGTGDTLFGCVPGQLLLCRPCTADADCVAKGDPDALCIDHGASGRFCGSTCQVAAGSGTPGGTDCPAGYACEQAQGTQGQGKQCVRMDGLCACSNKAIAQGASTKCYVKNVAGTCTGTRKCAVDGLTACNAVAPAAESCNGGDDDCDGKTDEEGAAGCNVLWLDLDGDGFGGGKSSALGKKQCLCQPADKYTAAVPGDCDDNDKLVNPDKAELCNDVDDDCAGGTDEGCDDDKDGFCDAMMSVIGAPKVCFAGLDKDCDDQKAASNPKAKEICGNLADDDCNGTTDVGEDAAGCVPHYFDGDGDGAGSKFVKCLCGPMGSYTAKIDGDCNDDDAKVGPTKPEVCANAKDDDCDGEQDEPDAAGCTPFWADADSDGYGAGTAQCLCAPSASYSVKKGGDCNDKDPKQNPSMVEVCNGFDDDCGGDIDEKDAVNCSKFYADADKDGFGATAMLACLCKPDSLYAATVAGDCDDQQAKANPQAKEACDGFDNDCDSAVDEVNAVGCVAGWTDADGDGFGDIQKTACVCALAPPYTVNKGGDCNDGKKTVFPGASEVCNGEDDDCEGGIDEEGATGCSAFLYDGDGDGAGLSGKAKCLCSAAKPWSAQKGDDCNDGNPAVKPGAAELCNGIDDDCNGKTDEGGSTGCTNFYPDADGDGYGPVVPPQCLCVPGASYKVTQTGDCDDSNSSVYPKAKESCDGVDTDCDGVKDPIGALGCKPFYADGDGDGYGVSTAAQCACSGQGLFTAQQGGDCNDANGGIKPGAIEVCDGVDNNCNGIIDIDAPGAKIWYADNDGDGFGGTASVLACAPQGVFKASLTGDCNDGNAKIHPAAAEICNGTDDNCNGTADDGPAAILCQSVPNAAGVCQAGACVAQCTGKNFNVDGQYGNGCECQADSNYGGVGIACVGAQDLGSLGDGGSSVQKGGNIMPGEAGDWYRFRGVDSADGNSACDKFSVKAKLTGNPDGYFALDLYRGNCSGSSQLCAGQTDTGWTVNFYGGTPSGPLAGKGVAKGDVVKSPNPEVAGECKCSGGDGLPGMNVCTDNSADFFVRVYRTAGAPASCTSYTLLVSNGL